MPVLSPLAFGEQACCAKLAYLFGKGLSPAQVTLLMTRNMRGEISGLSRTRACAHTPRLKKPLQRSWLPGPFVGESRAIARILSVSTADKAAGTEEKGQESQNDVCSHIYSRDALSGLPRAHQQSRL